MKYELNQKIFYMRNNCVHSAPILGRCEVDFVEDIHTEDAVTFGVVGVHYQTCHGVMAEGKCYPTREELLESL